ncbi:MAG: DUF4403 family protein [Saprospiraceae bacterium]|nr:DUF4403 family protein [Saprospiraceae bacterium]
MNRPSLLALLILAIAGVHSVLPSCKNEAQLHRPTEIQDTIPMDIPVSTFNIPVTYAIKDLEGFVNKIIRGKFMTLKINPLQNVKDVVKVEMFREKNIRLSSNGQELVCRFPVKVVATILKSRLNFLTKGIDPVETELELELRTPVALDAKWHLVTQFRLTKTTWVKPPIVTVAGINIDLTKKLDDYLKENEDKFIGLINGGINKSVSLEAPISKIWYNLQKPIVIHKKPPQAYLMFACDSISGDFVLDKDDIVCNTSIKASVVMLTDSAHHQPISKLPPFVFQKGSEAYSDVYLYAFTGFEDINEELAKRLNGKTFTAKGYTSKLESLKVYASDEGLTVDLTTSGDIKTNIIATGNPRYSPETHSIHLDNFQFNLVTNNIVLEAGEAYLHDMIRDTIQSQLSMGMHSFIEMVPGIVEQAIAKGKPGKSIDVGMHDLEVLSCDISLGAKRIHFKVHTSFAADIRLKKLKAKKQLRINPGK